MGAINIGSRGGGNIKLKAPDSAKAATEVILPKKPGTLATLEDISNITDLDAESLVHIAEQVEENKQDIIELEENLEAIAPSFDRGEWDFQEPPYLPSLPKPQTYYILNEEESVPLLYSQTHKILFSNLDVNDDNHTWLDVEVGQYLEMFDERDGEFLLAKVDAIELDAFFATFEVSVLKSDGGPKGTSGDDERTHRVRVKFFELAGEIDLDTLMPKSGGTFTGQVKHKKEIIIEPTLPNTFVTVKNRYTTNPDGTDTGNSANGTGFGLNFDLDHGNSGYNQVKWSTRLGDIINISGGTGAGAKYTGKMTDDKHLVNKGFIVPKEGGAFTGKVEFKKPYLNDESGLGFTIKGAIGDDYTTTTVSNEDGDILSVFHNDNEVDAMNYRGKIDGPKNIVTKEYVDKNVNNTYSLTSGPQAYRKKGSESLGEHEFGVVGSNVGSTNVLFLNKLYLNDGQSAIQVKDYEATDNTWFEVYRNSVLILKMQIKKDSWRPSVHVANQIQCNGVFPYPLVGLTENWSNTTNYKILITGLKKKPALLRTKLAAKRDSIREV